MTTRLNDTRRRWITTAGVVTSLSLLPLFATACEVHHRVRHVTADAEPAHQGIVYSLPRTRVTVTLPVTAVSKERGHFFASLANLFHDNKLTDDHNDLLLRVWVGLINQNIATWDQIGLLLSGEYADRSIKIDDAVLTTAPAWNNDLLFLVEWPDDAAEARTLSVALNEAGFLTSASATARDQTLDIAIKTLETVATIAGHVFLPGSGSPEVNVPKSEELAADPARKLLSDALATLERLKEIGERRRNLIAPTNPADARLDKSSLESRLALLEAERAKLLQFFIKQRTIRWSAVFSGEPTKTCDTQANGLLAVTTVPLSGNGNGRWMYLTDRSSDPLGLVSPIPAALAAGEQNGNGQPTSRVHAITLRSVRDYRWESQTGADKDGALGFRYRVPGEAVITHLVQNPGDMTSSVKKRWTEMIAQFGPVRALPTSVGTADASISIELHPDLGSLKTVSAESKVTLVDQAGNVGTGLGSLFGTLEKATESPSELDRLNTENALLEARKKNAELKEALGEQ